MEALEAEVTEPMDISTELVVESQETQNIIMEEQETQHIVEVHEKELEGLVDEHGNILGESCLIQEVGTVTVTLGEVENSGEVGGGVGPKPVSQSSGGGPLTCNICEQQFGRQSHLTRHIEACHGERGIYTCTECTATFNRKDSLNRHVTTQHGENPRRYKCTVVGCDKDFNRKDHLNKHLRGVHKIEPVASYSHMKMGGGITEDEERSGDDDTPMIMDVSSLRPEEAKVATPYSSNNKDKRFKCSNEGCGVEYSSLAHLHRHMSRGHSSDLQLPVFGHSVFGSGEMKFDAVEEEGEVTLCMFCCSSYQNNKDIEKQRKAMIANDPHFTKFCEAALRQQRKRMSANTIIKSLNSLNKLSVCQQCFSKIGYAMGTKVAADDVEARVENLRRQLDAELKNLQSEVDQFYGEMKMIEAMIRDSDLSSLESYLAGLDTELEKEQSSVVFLLRDGIFAVMKDVELYCKRIRGQQIVVNTPPIFKKSAGTSTPSKAKEGRRLKPRKKRKTRRKSKLDPLLHVRVDIGPGGEDSSQPSTPAGQEDAEKDPSVVDKNLTTRPMETPRRQPVREARVRTEEFLKSLFEKQKAGDAEDLEAVVKTEMPSDTEVGSPGEPVPHNDPDSNKDAEIAGDGEAGEKLDGTGEEQYIGKKEKAKAAAAAASSSVAAKGDEKSESDKGEEDASNKDGEGKGAGTPPPIEEILIEGDDELEDLFYEDETSDEDFNLDITQDDIDSGSESEDSAESDDSFGDPSASEDDDEEEPVPKRARERRKRSARKSDFDPFKFRKSSKTPKATKTKSNNKLAQQHNIDMSGMSEFRQRLLCRILKKNSKRQSTSPPPDPLSSSTREPDPRVNFRFEYNKDEGTLVLGDVQVIIHDEHSSLQCSKCGYLSSPAEKPRRSVPRIMYNHILGKHLFAFQCPQCSATLGSYRRYLDHIKGHQMGFMCDICGKPLFSEEALRRHRWGHQNAEEMAEAIRQGIKDPRRKHDPTLTFQCTTCGKVFSKKMLLRQHEKTHAENRERIVCTLCGKTFLPSGFISHQKYSCFPEGYEPPRVQCQLCPSTFKSVVLRARHMKYAHSTASIEKPFKCHICGKGFAANEHLQKHIKRHSDARPYLCRKGCGANYKTRKDCTRHEKKCEGNGTPMMRHKGRNDQLAAVPIAKKEPVEEQVVVTEVHLPPPPPVVIQQQPTLHQQQQQFNVYNIL